MEKKIKIGSKDCLLFEQDVPQAVLIQMMDQDEREGMAEEIKLISEGASEHPFVMVAVCVEDWLMELTPWHDDMVSKRTEVGDGVKDTLYYIETSLIPWIKAQYGDLPIVLGGYSLGGLFALWATSQTDTFEAIAAASPSVWIKDWIPYSTSHPALAKHIYLSLGDKEELARNKAIAQVGDNIRAEYELLKASLGEANCTLEWNPGNHFKDAGKRLAKAFAWCLNKMTEA